MTATTTLPAGYSAGPQTLADAGELTALARFCEEHDLGEPLVDLDDIICDWQRPSFNLSTDSLAVRSGDAMVAYAEVFKGRRAEAAVHPAHRGRGIGNVLLRWTWEVAAAHGSSLVGQTVGDTQIEAQSLFHRHSYERLWTSWILELGEGEQMAPAPLPNGVKIQTFHAGRDEQAAYEVLESSFNEWPDREPSTYADWAAGVFDRPSFEAWHLLVVVEGAEVVGVCHLTPSDGTSWVNQIAVRRDRRGFGLGRGLLMRAFEEGRSRGYPRAELATDTRTGALGLYEHVGMTVKSSFGHWARHI